MTAKKKSAAAQEPRRDHIEDLIEELRDEIAKLRAHTHPAVDGRNDPVRIEAPRLEEF